MTEGFNDATFPIQVAVEDMEAAHWIIALEEAEHLPLLQERFPAWTEKVEFWHVDDAPEVLDLIENEVMDLAARLSDGGKCRRGKADVRCVSRVLILMEAVGAIQRAALREDSGVVRSIDWPTLRHEPWHSFCFSWKEDIF